MKFLMVLMFLFLTACATTQESSDCKDLLSKIMKTEAAPLLFISTSAYGVTIAFGQETPASIYLLAPEGAQTEAVKEHLKADVFGQCVYQNGQVYNALQFSPPEPPTT